VPLPTPRLGLLVLAGAALWLAAALAPGLAAAAVALDAALCGFAVADALLLRRRGPLRLTRRVAPVLSRGAPAPVAVVVENRGAAPAALRLVETWPEDVSPRRIELAARAPAGGEVAFEYRVRPARRGRVAIAAAPLRVRGPFGLWERPGPGLPAAAVRVYPSLAEVGKYELMARRSLLAAYGVRRARPAGGTEIEALRDYAPGDDYRGIDWKATARRRRPVSRELHPSRRQHVLLCLDAGRHMTDETGRGTRFDCAVDAALVLAHVAARHGDRVGLLAFGRKVERYVAPRGGAAATPALGRALFDLAPALVEPDYAGAFRYLAAHDRRRALLIVFTDVVSEDASDALIAHLGEAARRHLPVAVCFADERLGALAAAAPRTARDAYERAAALELCGERARALHALERRGVQVVDAAPADVPAAVVSRYLTLKARLVL
jgi:uncharacterized protein (DUF58 family)